MRNLLMISTLIITFFLAGCGGEKYGTGIDSSAPKMKVKDLFYNRTFFVRK